jgi:nitrite reductase (NADH) small subunit
MPEFTPIAALNAVPVGSGITVHAAGRNVALFNLDGEIHALNGICPHKGGPLGEGFCENGRVYCPLHGWQFDIRTGDCIDRPDKPAERLAVRVSGEMIEVAL